MLLGMKTRVFVSITLFAFASQTGFAASPPKLSGAEALVEKSASEFVLRRYPGERLVPIRMVGGVSQPGTYYVPVGTDFLSLLSLAGGIAPNSNSSAIQVRQWNNKVSQELDLSEAMENPAKSNPTLEANDIIFVPEQKPLISNNTFLALSVAASVISLVLGSIAIRKETR